ncbi:recombination protein RecR [Candidatus Microgenomates bacterium]|nr:MAG: recombination protein RecR [Candidatus Microgenomates bacterium]
MSKLARPLVKLIEHFEKLPGIGKKSAQRLAFYLLHVPQQELEQFADALVALKTNTKECSICFNVSETDPCEICVERSRDTTIICVVEQALDILSFERTGKFSGVYHVLHGALNPLANIGPDEIRISQLISRLQKSTQQINEIILATNLSMEGEATAMYIQRQIKQTFSNGHTIKITRIAHGLPMGADVEYADEMTLSQALLGRREY